MQQSIKWLSISSALFLAGLSSSSAWAHAPCQTASMQQASREWRMPAASIASAILPSLRGSLDEDERPVSAQHIDSSTLPLRVHATAEVPRRRLELALAAAELAWHKQVDEQGFAAPLPDGNRGGDDRLDLYLTAVSDAGGVTIGEGDNNTSDGRHAMPVYILLDSNTDETEIPTLVVHEFQHACQFAMDSEESIFFGEASAVAQEALTFPTTDLWQYALVDFQTYPQAPIFTDGYAWYDATQREALYEYGAVMFSLYIDAHYGDGDGTFLRELWEGTIQSDDVVENEPDWLDVLSTKISKRPSDVILDFARERILVGPRAPENVDAAELIPYAAKMTGDATLRARRLLPAALVDTPLPFFAIDEYPFQYGCVAFEVSTPSNPLHIYIAAQSDPETTTGNGPLGLSYVRINGRSLIESKTPIVANAKIRHDIALNPDDTLVLMICDVGNADADDFPEVHPIKVVIDDAPIAVDIFEKKSENDAGLVVDPDPNEETDAGITDPYEDGIGFFSCQGVPPGLPAPSKPKENPMNTWRGAMGVAGAILGLGGLLFKMVRNQRRKALYNTKKDTMKK